MAADRNGHPDERESTAALRDHNRSAPEPGRRGNTGRVADSGEGVLTDAQDPVDVVDAISTRTEKQVEASGSLGASYRCDMCGAARTRSERQRLVWDTGLGIELILAELCRQCAEHPGPFLVIYGGRGHDALRVTQADAVSGGENALGHTMRGIVLRGLVYVLLALAAFVVVTTVSRG